MFINFFLININKIIPWQARAADKPTPARTNSGFLFVFRFRGVRPAMPLGEERRHILAVLIPPAPMPAVHVTPAHRSVPEQEPQAAKDQEQQEQRDQAAQQAEPNPKKGCP